jgi:prolyl-tRNA synthetase
MKASEITYGTECWANVSGKRRQVVVVSIRQGRGRKYGLALHHKGGMRLTARRSGAALHICGHNEWASMTEARESITTACPDCCKRYLDSMETARHNAMFRACRTCGTPTRYTSKHSGEPTCGSCS